MPFARPIHETGEAVPTPPEPPLHAARDLVDAQGLARIALDGRVYVLRITRQGKLILTK
mgnify:CR=1 FL=1